MESVQKFAQMFRTPRISLLLSRTLHQFKPSTGTSQAFTKLPPSVLQPKRIMPIKGYLYLPGNQDPGMPSYAPGPRENFPYALQCSDSNKYVLEDWGKILREILDEYLPLHGAVMVRGLPVSNFQNFSNLMDETGYQRIGYNFGSDRRKSANKNTFGNSIEASAVLIEMHTEGAYRPNHIQLIRKIVFYCDKPCKELFGGETPICKVADVYARLKPSFIKKLKEKGITYSRIMAHPDQDPVTNWKTRMGVDNEEEAEIIMKKLGCHWRWNSNGSVTYWHTKPAFIKHPDTGEEVMFHQLTTHHKSYCDYVSSYEPSDNWEDYAAGTHTTYGDGEEFDTEDLQDYRNAQWNTCATVRLEKGDILFMDNIDVQHGRLNYHGERQLYISLTSD